MTLQEWCKQNNKENLLNEWDYEKNADSPSKISTGSNKKVWWKCSDNHEWETVVKSRIVYNVGCPYCSGRLAIKGLNDLATTNLDLVKEWNYDKNIIGPAEVKAGSNKKVWWKCSNNHEWEASISGRAIKGLGCPVCSNRLIIKGVNDLATTNPDLAKEWDYNKNTISPTEISAGSGKKVWWKCKNNHGWQAPVYNRAIKDNKCPVCSNRLILKGFNDLATTNPELAKEWNYDKNILKPTKISAGSNKKVWWKCPKNHEWEAIVNSRVRGRGCPYCSGLLVTKGVSDLATTNPELLPEWNFVKNTINPSEVSAYSDKKVWWKCSENHEWEATIHNRSRGAGCPVCSNRLIIKGINDLATTNPELLPEWDYEKNTIKPSEVSSGSGKEVCWRCQFGHEWKTEIYKRTEGAGCPVCAKETKTSFPEQALFFYIKKYYPDAINTDNDTIGMELDIYIPSLKTAVEYDGAIWHKNNKSELKKNELCKKNNIILIRIREEGLKLYNDCYCIVRTNIKSNDSLSETIKKVLFTIDNTLDINIDVNRDSTLIYNSYIMTRKSRSLANAYPEIAKEWHPTKNGKITPEMVSPGTNKKFWWFGKCNHEWQAEVCNRTEGTGCPICTGKKIISGINDLLTRYPDVCTEWCYEKNNEIGLFPNEVSSGSHKKAWWKCKTCKHIWKSSISNRTQGKKCPVCNKKYPKKVRCIETETIYNSLIDAAKVIGLKQGDTISLCCQGKRKTAGGYHWEYLDDNK